METKLFAIKIPRRLKDAMDYTSKESGRTLSKLYYDSLQKTIFEIFGLVVLYKIDRRGETRLEDLLSLLSDKNVSQNIIPGVVADFLDLMDDDRNRQAFSDIFNNLIIEEDGLTSEMDYLEIARYVGHAYLEREGNLEKIELSLGRDIFFNYMISVYYRTSAVGSLKVLNTEWYRKQRRVKAFQEELISQYLEKYKEEKVDAIELEEVLEVIELEDIER
jgi:hypothetical protein